jgi:Zn-dependent protease
MALKLGWGVKDIVIYPIGGAASIYSKYKNPTHEMLMALAGPAVSFMLMLLGMVLVVISAHLEEGATAVYLCLVGILVFASNFVIFAFNMVPVFPMDGGRVLRATLAYKLGYHDATVWAIRISQFVSCVLAFTLVYCAITYSYPSLIVSAVILLLMPYVAQSEFTTMKLHIALDTLKIKLAEALDNPDLANADLPTIISVLKEVKDEKLREDLQMDDTLSLLEDLSKAEVSI